MEFIKRTIYFHIFLSLGLIYISSASGSEIIPKFCQFYPKYIDGKKVIQEVSQEDKNLKHIQCYQDERVEFTIDNLSKAMDNIEEDTLQSISNNLKKRLTFHGVKQTIEKKYDYDGLFENLSLGPSNELLECGRVHSKYDKSKLSAYDKVQDLLTNKFEYNPDIAIQILKDRRKKKSSVNKIKQRDFLMLNLINGLKVSALLDINKNHSRDSKRAEEDYDKALSKCRSYVNRYNITSSKKYRPCYEKAKELKNKRQDELAQQIAPLYDMVHPSPLLFNNSDQGSILSVLESDKLSGSPFLAQIKSVLPNKALRRVKFLLQNNDNQGLEEYLKNNVGMFNEILDNPDNYEKLYSSSRAEVAEEIERLNKAAEALCMNEGENLHHYPGLVEAAMNDMTQKSLNKDILFHQTRAAQAGYCHLLHNEPIGKNEMSAATIGGLALLGVGAALQVVPVLGNISGGMMISVGAGLALTSGGAILTGQGFVDAYKSQRTFNQDIALHSVGLKGYEDLLESKNTRDLNVVLSGVDAVLVPIDLKLIAMAKKEAKSAGNSQRLQGDNLSKRVANGRFRRYDNYQRKMINELFDDKKMAERIKILNNRYNPKNINELSKADKAYYGAVADMIEKDVAKEFPKLNMSQRRAKVQEKLDNIIKECRGEKKKD